MVLKGGTGRLLRKRAKTTTTAAFDADQDERMVYQPTQRRVDFRPAGTDLRVEQRPILATLTAEFGAEEGRALWRSRSLDRVAYSVGAKRSRTSQRTYDVDVLQFHDFAVREGFGPIVADEYVELGKGQLKPHNDLLSGEQLTDLPLLLASSDL